MEAPMRLAIILAVAAGIGLTGFASADPRKDESGKGREYKVDRDKRDRTVGRGNREAQTPYGHQPPPGECRDWYRNRPAGHQPHLISADPAITLQARN